MAEFAQYAMAAAEEAIRDSGISPFTAQDKERTVSLSDVCSDLPELVHLTTIRASHLAQALAISKTSIQPLSPTIRKDTAPFHRFSCHAC